MINQNGRVLPFLSEKLISGFMAKESVVSTLGVLFGTSSLSTVLTPLSAASPLAFCLLYTPCVAAITSVSGTPAPNGPYGRFARRCLDCGIYRPYDWHAAVICLDFNFI